MSTLMQRNNEYDPNNPLYYAPRWLREEPPRPTEPVSPTQGLPPRTARDEVLRPPTKVARPGGGVSYRFDTPETYALRETLEPEELDAPSDYVPKPRSDWLGVLVWGTSAVVVSAVVALGIVLSLQYSKFPTPATASRERTTLVVSDGGGNTNQMLPLGVRVNAPVPGATVGLHGLPLGAMVTMGKAGAGGEWRIPLKDLAGTFVIPPNDFTGEMRLGVVLRAPEGGAMVSNTLRLVWAPSPASPVLAAPASPAEPAASSQPTALSSAVPAPAATAPPPPRSPQSGDVIRQLDPKEIAILLKRAEELVADGDFLPARALLQRAAEAGNARAAFVLAGTYDPDALKKFGANGAAPNKELAQAWYQKAKAWGQKEAEPRLETLAISGR